MVTPLLPHFYQRPLRAEIPVAAKGGVGFRGLVGMAQPGMLGLGPRAVGCGGRRWRDGPGRRTEQLLERDLERAMRALDDRQQRIGRGLPARGRDVALGIDGARGPLEDDLEATDLRRHAVPVGVGLAIGE